MGLWLADSWGWGWCADRLVFWLVLLLCSAWWLGICTIWLCAHLRTWCRVVNLRMKLIIYEQAWWQCTTFIFDTYGILNTLHTVLYILQRTGSNMLHNISGGLEKHPCLLPINILTRTIHDCKCLVLPEAPQVAFDTWKHLFDRVEVGWVWRKEQELAF